MGQGDQGVRRDRQLIRQLTRPCGVRRLITVAALLLGVGAAAAAEDYPNRPITLVVPFPPGGTNTIMARVVADQLSERLGQQVIVDNRGAGASGTVGTRQVAKSPPDGYTILLAYTSTLATAPSMYAALGYDPRKDFAPIGLIASAPSVLSVHPSLPVRNLAELIGVIKQSNGLFQYGSPGVGSVNHLAAELLSHTAGLKMVHIPYKGTSPLMTDLIGGHVKMAFAPIPVSRPNIEGGNIRAIGVTSLKRSALLKDIPTLNESGLPGFEVSLRYGLVAPAGTPHAIVARLNKELNAALASEAVHKRLATEGAEPLPSTPEDYAADIDREETKWSKLAKAIGWKPE